MMIELSNELATLEKNYLFSLVAKKKAEYRGDRLINLGIGDVSKPLRPYIAQAMKQAIDEMTTQEGIHGYGPECGYPFLKEAVIQSHPAYHTFTPDEVLINDGIINDMARFPLHFQKKIRIAIQDPCFPPYFENLKFFGLFDTQTILLPCTKENHFIPDLPQEPVDLIILCSPHNPTGVALDRVALKKWIDYAKEVGALILFDAAYQAFISQDNIPHSIYEVEGAKEVAIEFCSLSKSAGFTGLRCGYFFCPKELNVCANKKPHPFLPYVEHAKSICTNGVAYPIQKGAAAALNQQGQQEMQRDCQSYMEATKLLKEGLEALNLTLFGGENCPYIWLKTPPKYDSFAFFECLLDEYGIVCVPGIGFGALGENYVRLSGFINKEIAREALDVFTQVKEKYANHHH